jgi:hypothetical protein
MESFAGLEHKYSYSMYGHSGAAVEVPLVLDGSPPRDREARLDVINRIYEHVSYVKSGDNTLASALAAVQQVTEHPGDDYFVFLLSDAMLEQYNVSPQNLADALLVDPRVNSYCIFIGACTKLDHDGAFQHMAFLYIVSVIHLWTSLFR